MLNSKIDKLQSEQGRKKRSVHLVREYFTIRSSIKQIAIFNVFIAF